MDIMSKEEIHFEIRYAHKELQWFEVLYTDGDFKISERIEFNLDEKINEEYHEISSKIGVLCDCVDVKYREECRKEADTLTKEYIRMYYKFSNHRESQGRTEIDDDSKVLVNMQNISDIKSGWVCFNWAFLTQRYLSRVKTKYFKMQWNAHCLSYPEIGKKDVFGHNWIGLKIAPEYCPGTEGIIHLDPWLHNRIGAYFPNEHDYHFAWNYIGKISKKLGEYEGTYYDENDIPFPVGNAFYTSWVLRWPKWFYEVLRKDIY
jgi:hypothetical protein